MHAREIIITINLVYIISAAGVSELRELNGEEGGGYVLHSFGFTKQQQSMFNMMKSSSMDAAHNGVILIKCKQTKITTQNSC